MTVDLLDNIGITVKVGDLPSIDRYHDARRQRYGTHWLSRFYKRRVFPWLRPVACSEANMELFLASKRVRAEFLSKVIEEDAINDA